MTVDEAYRRLDLVPLDDFLGQPRPLDSPTRGIGATTWMCVSAAVELWHNRSVMIVSSKLDRAYDTFMLTRSYALGLGLVPHKGTEKWWHPDCSCTYSTNSAAARAGLSGQATVFCDEEWKERAIVRRNGPFESIAEIRRHDDRNGWVSTYHAFDTYGNYLMELTSEGAKEAMDKWGILLRLPPVRAEGF